MATKLSTSRAKSLAKSLQITCTALGVVAMSISSGLQAAVTLPQDLAELSLEDLTNTRVTSVSKRSEPIANAAASVFVITNDAIRRAGVSTLPEALRLAPNIQVGRIDARSYAITARGFNSTLVNKLLVLIDGRSVYSPLFSGVFWEAQDVMLDDVERIEVISGPGGTLWGANAVNGVVNIITKRSAATQGALATASATRLHQSTSVRYGARLANGAHYRMYAKAAAHDDVKREAGGSSLTGWQRSQLGFRADWGQLDDATTLQGDAYAGRLHQAAQGDIEIAGANLLGQKMHKLQGGAEVRAQIYWDFTKRHQPNTFTEHLNTVDVQVQSALAVNERHRLVTGAGYRVAMDRIENSAGFSFLPGDKTLRWGNVFLQSESDLTQTVRLIAGAKFEHNNYSGLEFLPTLRLAWKPTAESLLWSAASRTVRAPSRIDRDFYTPSAPNVVNGMAQYTFAGGPDFQSEVAKVFELGYRAQPTAALSYSVTTFFSDYDRLRTIEPAPSGLGQIFANMASGRTRGLEAWGTWQVTPAWRLVGGTVFQRVSTSLRAGSKDTTATTSIANGDPNRYLKLRSSFDIAPGHSLDLVMRHYGKLSGPGVPAYTALDANYLLQLGGNVELSISGKDLLGSAHAEFGPAATRSITGRQIGAKLVWRP